MTTYTKFMRGGKLMQKTERVDVKEAAKVLEMNTESVRYLMQKDRLPIGYAMRREGKKRWAYYIYRGLLEKEVERLANGGQRKW